MAQSTSHFSGNTSHTSPQPTRIEAIEGSVTQMRLEWSTGQKFSVPYTELRFECPCAACVDEHTGKRIIQREHVPAQVKVNGAEVVGRYAIQFKFSDGHATGLYPFERLYQLCERKGTLCT